MIEWMIHLSTSQYPPKKNVLSSPQANPWTIIASDLYKKPLGEQSRKEKANQALNIRTRCDKSVEMGEISVATEAI